VQGLFDDLAEKHLAAVGTAEPEPLRDHGLAVVGLGQAWARIVLGSLRHARNVKAGEASVKGCAKISDLLCEGPKTITGDFAW
jgi:hypothetical protein